MRATETDRTTADGARLFTRRFEPHGEPKGIVCLLHGICEHSGRYARLAERLCAEGYTLSTFDQRGHGRSDGIQVRVEAMLRDVDDHLAAERASGLPLFLYGHSMGGLLALAYGFGGDRQLDGVIASGPALHTVGREHRGKVLMARLLGGIWPSLTVPTVLDPEQLTRDPEVVRDYLADPLVRRRIPVGLARDLLDAMDRVLAETAPFCTPLLLLHGGADRVNYPSGSEAVAARLGEGCTLRIYDGVLHQPHTDPDADRVFDDVVAWLDERVASRAA